MEYEASFGQWLTLRRQALHLPRGELAGRAGCAVVTLGLPPAMSSQHASAAPGRMIRRPWRLYGSNGTTCDRGGC